MISELSGRALEVRAALVSSGENGYKIGVAYGVPAELQRAEISQLAENYRELIDAVLDRPAQEAEYLACAAVALGVFGALTSAVPEPDVMRTVVFCTAFNSLRTLADGVADRDALAGLGDL